VVREAVRAEVWKVWGTTAGAAARGAVMGRRVVVMGRAARARATQAGGWLAVGMAAGPAEAATAAMVAREVAGARAAAATVAAGAMVAAATATVATVAGVQVAVVRAVEAGRWVSVGTRAAHDTISRK
jgi:hypothetical protein